MSISFDFETLSERDRYKLMIGTVIPRPIALVTTVDEHGRINAAPFSFFNCLSADPPILALGVENNPDMSFKDTGHNIRMTEVFTVNIVSFAIAEAMHVCGSKYPRGVDELKEAGLTAMPGTKVASPWIAEAPAAFECKRHLTLELGKVAADHHGRDRLCALSRRRRRSRNVCASIRQRSMPLRVLAATPAARSATASRC
jgi:flavin reductase (DIM6/NTAB) family NADH-FMN oxidoreductase RutF